MIFELRGLQLGLVTNQETDTHARLLALADRHTLTWWPTTPNQIELEIGHGQREQERLQTIVAEDRTVPPDVRLEPLATRSDLIGAAVFTRRHAHRPEDSELELGRACAVDEVEPALNDDIRG